MVLACVASFAAGAGVMRAQQQAQNATRREPQFENDQVTVWKSIVMPNSPLALHRHDHGRALIALTGGELHVVDKDRKRLSTIKLKKGTALWLDADPAGQEHADVNDGKKPIEVIVVQLKKDR
jgi:quercetin dioxygenase-like cupin family protein